MILKWKDFSGKWITLYRTAILNRLRRDKNLSDLTDRADARKNLELVNEVTTHYHDARYQPKFDALNGLITKEIDNLKKTLSSQYTNNTDLESKLNTLKQNLITIITTNVGNVSTLTDNLDKKLASEITTRQNNDKDHATRLANLETFKSYFHVGDSAPSGPVNGKSVWFCTAGGASSIRVYWGNKWKTLGAAWES